MEIDDVMAHEHHHHHHHFEVKKGAGDIARVLLWCIIINGAYVVYEAAAGFSVGSVGLLSDAGHNLLDVCSLALSLFAVRLSHVEPSAQYTYGFKKTTVLISLINALLLLVAVVMIAFESIDKLVMSRHVDGVTISVTAFVGIVVNGATAWLLLRQSREDINIRGAFLHMLTDTLVSVGVVVSGVVIALTDFTYIDPIVGLLVAIIIVVASWRLLMQSIRMVIDGVPESIDASLLISTMAEVEHVRDVHHMHVWALSTTETALTAHVVVDDLMNMEQVKAEVKHRLKDMGVCHSTIEIETAEHPCHEERCMEDDEDDE